MRFSSEAPTLSTQRRSASEPRYGGVFGEFRKPPHVPGQTLSERRMEKALQRPVDPRQHVPQIPQQR